MRSRVASAVRLGVPIVVVAAIGCSLPSRDNPNDPGIKPNAVLTVSNGNLDRAHLANPTLACPAGSLDNQAISRKRCVRLDGSASTDPQDDIADYTFRVVYVDTAHVERPVIFERTLSSATSGVAFLSDDDLRGMPPNRSYDVHLTVTDRAGHVSTAGVAVIHITNSQPQVVSPGPREVPFYGEAWGTSGLTVTLLGGQSSDADDDPLCYCWTPIVVPTDQQTALTTRGDGAAAFAAGHDYCSRDRNLRLYAAPAAGPEALVMRLQLVGYVDNPPAGECLDASGQVEKCCHKLCRYPENCSQATFATVQLARHSPAWSVLADSGQVGELRDINRSFVGPLPNNVNERPDVAFAANGDPSAARVFVASGAGSTRDQLAWVPAGSTVPGVAPISLAPDPIDVQEIRYDPVRERAWAWGARPSDHTFVVYSIAAPRVAGTLTIERSWATGIAYSDMSEAEVDPATGRLWVLPTFGNDLLVFDPASAAVLADFPSSAGSFAFSALAVRRMPGQANQVWAIEFSTTDTPSPRIHVYDDPPGGTPVEDAAATVTLEPEPDGSPQVPLMLRFVDPDPQAAPAIAWTNVVGLGLTALEIVSDAQNPSHLVVSRLARVTAPFGRVLVVDHRTGNAVFVSDDHHTIVHASLDGSSSSLLSTTSIVTLAGPDPDGLLWIFEGSGPTSGHSPATLSRGAGTGDDAVIGRFPLPATPGSPGVDFASGDLLVTEAVPPRVERLATSGNVIDVIDHYLPIAGATPPSTLPSPLPSLVLPGLPFSVYADPVDGTLWVASGSPTSNGATQLDKVLPYAPRAAEFPNAAMVLTGARVAPGDPIASAAVDPLDHDLWVVTLHSNGGTSYNVVLSRYSGEGVLRASTIVATPTIPSANGSSRPQLARDLSSGEVCVAWIDTALANNPFMRRYRFDGVGVAQVGGTYSSASGASVVSAIAASRGDCWIAAQGGSTLVEMWEPLTGAVHAPDASVPQTTAILPLNGSLFEMGKGRPAEAWIGGATTLERVVLTTAGTLHAVDSVPLDFATSLQNP